MHLILFEHWISMINLLKVFMLLSSKNDESDGIKTFEAYSSYIILASNIFKQTKMLICFMVYIVETVWLFEMKVPIL